MQRGRGGGPIRIAPAIATILAATGKYKDLSRLQRDSPQNFWVPFLNLGAWRPVPRLIFAVWIREPLQGATGGLSAIARADKLPVTPSPTNQP